MAEVSEALDATARVDHVTLVGDGEPSLSKDLGLLIGQIGGRSDVPVAVVTNGSMLHDRQVREEMMAADRVLPTLATAEPEVWQRMHRPHRDLDLSKVVQGLLEFSQDYEGDLWVEVMLVQGLNHDEASLVALGELLQRIGPDRLDLLVPTRPPAESWVKAPDPARVLRAMEVLGVPEALAMEFDGPFSVSNHSSGREALMAIGSRHPLREEDAEEICRLLDDGGAVAGMVEEGQLVRVDYREEVFLMPRHLVKIDNDEAISRRKNDDRSRS